MTFQRYESRPVTRLAHEIQADDLVTKPPNSTGRMRLRTKGGVDVTFVHHEPVNTGDFVVYLSEEDIYHCRREVFLERNIVPGAPEDQEEEEAVA